MTMKQRVLQYFDILNEELSIAHKILIFLVKKAYYKQSLKVHPDRVSEEEKENATEKFQTLGKVYSILSDEEKRKIYDETGKFKPLSERSRNFNLVVFAGCVDDDDFSKGDMNWDDYWRLLFQKVTEKDIVEFEKKYKGSEEETSDIKKLYERYEVNILVHDLQKKVIDNERLLGKHGQDYELSIVCH